MALDPNNFLSDSAVHFIISIIRWEAKPPPLHKLMLII